MSETSAPIEIPKRALFKASEVCELVRVQPYVLRTWEAEFPGLGVSKTPGSPRVYGREDVEQVLRIKHLLLVEGLTLAGARRKLEDDATPASGNAPVIDELIGRNARERLTEIKRGLRSLLDLLGPRSGNGEFRLSPPAVVADSVRRVSASREKPGRGKTAPSPPAVSPRRKRSA